MMHTRRNFIACMLMALPPWRGATAADAATLPTDFAEFAGGLAQPRGLLFAPDGSLYVAEQLSGEIARIGVDGRLTRIARGFESPHDLELDAAGHLYVADTGAGRIAKIDRAGTVSTFVDELESPVDLAFAPNGELWVCELTGKVRAFASATRSRTVVALKGPHGLAFARNGDTFINDWRGNQVVRLDAKGLLHPFADLAGPVGLSFSPAGELIVAQPQARRITRIGPDGRQQLLAEGLREPRDPVFDRQGRLYVAETMAGRVLRHAGRW